MKKISVIASLVFGSLLVGGAAFASMYEWFSYGALYNLTAYNASFWPTPEPLPANSNDQLRLKYTVQTSGPFVENRSVYIVSTTSTGDLYLEIPSCRQTGLVANTSNGSCDFAYDTSGGNSHTVRVTTNYAECGSYTPTPADECGHVMDFPLTSR